jgi:hypothetical protein
MKCPSCGATISEGSRKCVFCGEAVAAGATSSAAAEQPTNVFERIRQSPQFQQASGVERLSQIAKPGLATLAIPVVFLIVFVTAALGMAGMAASMAPPIFVVVPVGLAVIGIMMGVAVIRGGIRIAKAPLVPRAAVVRAKRTSVSGDSNGASTSYYATFEFSDGSRSEFSLSSVLYSQIAERDGGVLFSRAETVAAFDRVTEAS